MGGKIGWVVVVLVVLALLALAFAAPTWGNYWTDYWNAYFENAPYMPLLEP